jgi:hypothetical protein
MKLQLHLFSTSGLGGLKVKNQLLLMAKCTTQQYSFKLYNNNNNNNNVYFPKAGSSSFPQNAWIYIPIYW